MIMFSIFDRKAQSYEMPSVFLFRNKELAKRAVSQAFLNNQLGALVSQYPEDFELWALGEFDQTTGAIIPQKEYVCAIADFKEVKQDAEK